MDKFPEALERFEETVDVSRIRSFEQLHMAFGLWAGEKWIESPKQLEALRGEVRRRTLRRLISSGRYKPRYVPPRNARTTALGLCFFQGRRQNSKQIQIPQNRSFHQDTHLARALTSILTFVFCG